MRVQNSGTETDVTQTAMSTLSLTYGISVLSFGV